MYIQAENEVSDVVLGYSSSSDISSLVTISEFSTITTGNFCLADSIDWGENGRNRLFPPQPLLTLSQMRPVSLSVTRSPYS